MKKFSTWVIKFRILIISLSLLITGIMGYFLKNLKINPDITTYLPENDSIVATFNYIGKHYSSSLMAMVIMEAKDDVFNKETLQRINELTNSLKQVEGVDYVTSLTNITDIRKTNDGFEIAKLIDENNIPENADELKKLKDYTLSKKMYRGSIVSSDSRYTLLVCRINQEVDKNEVAKNIKKVVLAKNYPEKFYFGGIPFQLNSIMDYVIRDLLVLTPMIVFLIAFTLFLSFKTLRGILIPVLTVAIGVVWSLGLMSILGIKMSPISDALPVVLFAVGSAYGIHVYNRFKLMVTDNANKKQQSAMALSSVATAVLLAGITTVIGFVSFIFGAYLNIISEFGVFSSLGILFILILSLTFAPALLSLYPAEKAKNKVPEKRKFVILDKLLEHIANAVGKHPKKILLFSIILIVITASGIPLLKNNIDILNYFRPKTDIRITASILNKEFGGSLPLMVRVRGDILQPEVLSKMKHIQQFLESQENIKNVTSVVNLLEEMNDCMGEGKKIPDTREKAANLIFLLEGDELLRQMINNDKSEAIIQAYVQNVDTKTYKKIYNSLNNLLAENNSEEVNFAQTGMPAVYAKVDESLMKNLLQSMILSFILVFFCMIFLLRSVKGAFIGLIPLLLTMIVVFGFMGYVGIALDICTILIASITIGAGIDYAIHFITEYRKQIQLENDINAAIKQTLKISGRSIVINISTVMLGFLVLIFANLLPLLYFGILIAITMLFSGFGAITILPSVINVFKFRLANNKTKTPK